MAKLFNRFICSQRFSPFYQQYGKTVQQSSKDLSSNNLFIEVDLVYGTSFNFSLNNIDAIFCIKIQVSNSRPCPREQHANLLPPKVAKFFQFPK